MRVKLCGRCPYTPRDLAGHYDPEAALHACAKCDGEQGRPTQHYPRKAYRRRACSTVPNIFGMAQRSAAPSVTESLVSSGTTPGELPFVQKGASIVSSPERRPTADGYSAFRLPDKQLQSESWDFAARRQRNESSMQNRPLIQHRILHRIGGVT